MRARTLAGVTGFAIGLWALVVRGALTLDLGVGRRLRPLGPLTVRIAAPREVVFTVISSPYLGRTPRALEKKLEFSSAATTSCSRRTTRVRTD